MHLRLELTRHRYPRTCTDKWRPTALPPQSKRAGVMLQLHAKACTTTENSLHGYWWLFRTQDLSCYSARLVEESGKKLD